RAREAANTQRPPRELWGAWRAKKLGPMFSSEQSAVPPSQQPPSVQRDAHPSKRRRTPTYAARLMGACRWGAALFFAATSHLAAAEPTLLKCQAKDYAGLNDHGLLDKRNLDFWLTTENFIVDLSTGAVRTQGLSKAVVWSIIQTGDSRNDWVLTPDAFWE